MKYPLFKNKSEPWAELVQAVFNDDPNIYSKDVEQELVILAKKCLMKDPKLRIRYIKWEDFIFPQKKHPYVELAKKRIKDRKKLASSKQIRNEFSSNNIKVEQLFHQISENCQKKIRSTCIGDKSFPRISIHEDSSIDILTLKLTIKFEASESFNLSKMLNILFIIKILDVKSNLIQIQHVCALSDNFSDEFLPYQTICFEGVYNNDYNFSEISSLLYLAFDKAQEYCLSKNHFSDLNSKVNDIHWIKIQIKENEDE